MKKLLLATATAATLALGGMTGVQAASTGVTLAEKSYSSMPAGVYKIDISHASITWKVFHLGLSKYTARFTRFDADLTFDPSSLNKSKLVATVDPTSIETDFPFLDIKDFDAKLVNYEEWFNAKKFPEIKFVSKKVKFNGDNTGTIEGDLTFLGVTKPLTLHATFNGAMENQPFSKKPTLGFSAKTTMNRSDWGFTTYVPNIGDEVELLIEAEFAKEQ